jgi:hypothetical protein
MAHLGVMKMRTTLSPYSSGRDKGGHRQLCGEMSRRSAGEG